MRARLQTAWNAMRFRAAFGVRYASERLRRATRDSGAARREPDAMPRIAVLYIRPIVGVAEHADAARRFADTYRMHAPGSPHVLHVIFNGEEPDDVARAPFEGLECEFRRHDNTGWDIGAFQAACRDIDADMVVCFGAFTYFRRSGWLARMAQVFRDEGPGLYGASATYECGPHVRTAGFWCHPELIRAYPLAVRTYDDRYAFEHGPTSITRLAQMVSVKCLMVTWDGIYSPAEWRSPPNIFRRGDQSNSLYYDRYFDLYDSLDDDGKAHHAALADGRG